MQRNESGIPQRSCHKGIAIYTHGQSDTWELQGQTVQAICAACGMGGGNTPLVLTYDVQEDTESEEQG